MTTDTITAVATAPGRGGVGVVRLSGPQSAAIAEKICGKLPPARFAQFTTFNDAQGEVIDSGLVLYFPNPASFTGEDVVELQGHGSPIVLDLLCQRAISLGARMARPGEFSERAFLNNKIDLAQAEAIADLIDSATDQAARGAVRSLQGEFSSQINNLLRQLIELRMFVEASIDFSDEEIDFLAEAKVGEQVQALLVRLESIAASAQQGSLLREGISVVLAGRPNAGKSSLHNRLAGHDAAIVTDVAGTTRDVLREQIHLAGLPLRISDTAGLHETQDVVEQEGIKRTEAEILQADHVLLISDDARHDAAILASLPSNVTVTLIQNKIDLNNGKPRREDKNGLTILYLSAKTGVGLDLLEQRLCEAAGFHPEQEGVFIARRRHLDALARARNAVETGYRCLTEAGAGELLAEELRQAQQALGEITGDFTTDDLLGEIFSNFCVGK